MNIRWLGHSSFLITSNSGIRIVTDPFEPAKVGIPYHVDNVDIVTSSHDHFDHGYIAAVKEYKMLIDSEGSKQYQDVKISSLSSFHDMTRGAERGKNLIFKFEMDNLAICHLGDLGEIPNDRILEFIKNTDILLIPVGGIYTIDSKIAKEYISLSNPSIVIPMHYMRKDYLFELEDVDTFLNLFDKEQVILKDDDKIDNNLDKDLFIKPQKIVVLTPKKQ